MSIKQIDIEQELQETIISLDQLEAPTAQQLLGFENREDVNAAIMAFWEMSGIH